jgi:hypothetical protein
MSCFTRALVAGVSGAFFLVAARGAFLGSHALVVGGLVFGAVFAFVGFVGWLDNERMRTFVRVPLQPSPSSPASPMSASLELQCPFCRGKFGVFSHHWKRQRDLAKQCPLCGKQVLVDFKASRFAAVFLPIAALGGAATYLLGAWGFLPAFFAAFTMPVFFSVYLDVPA